MYRFAHLDFKLRKYLASPFLTLGILGSITALVLMLWLAKNTGLQGYIVLIMYLIGIIFFFSLGLVTKVLTGKEDHVFYRNLIGILIANGLLLKVANQPLLPYLDIMILGMGVVQTIGRIGCHRAGCCYGRPFEKGVIYGRRSFSTSFPGYLINIPLFPTQLTESLLVGSAMILSLLLWFSQPLYGIVLATYLILYGWIRFLLEFFRGDPERPFLWGFSEAQWTSLILIATLGLLEYRGILPYNHWHVAASISLLGMAFILLLFRASQSSPLHPFKKPGHLVEIVKITESLTALKKHDTQDSVPNVETSSQGISISLGQTSIDGKAQFYYTISSMKLQLTERAAAYIASVVVLVKHSQSTYQVISGNNGMFHIIINLD